MVAVNAEKDSSHIIHFFFYKVISQPSGVMLGTAKLPARISWKSPEISTLGGVMMNLLCAAVSVPFSRRFLYANLALAIFNLLPVMSLDGGRLLWMLLSRRFLPKTCTVTLKLTTFVLLIPLMTAGIVMLFRSGYNYSLLAISLYLLAVLIFK